MFIGTIVFAIKIILAAVLVVPLFLSKQSPVSRERIGIYSLISIVCAAVTTLAYRMNSGWVAAALFIAVGIISYSQFQKEEVWQTALQAVAPLWLVAAIGMSVGAGMVLPAIILTAVAYYVINHLPILLTQDKGAGEERAKK
ncbi:MAG: hypothetical protein ACE5LH_10100 [Fidelibacterota bacterium]